MPARPQMMPPVGKSGPGIALQQCAQRSSAGACAVLDRPRCTPSITSRRLCGGMFVAMPTAMPVEPLTSRFGNGAAGRRALRWSRRSSGRSRRCPCRGPPSSLRRAPQARLGVAIRRRRVAVDRAEVALAVHQGVAHGEVLREADQRVVDRRVAVRVVVAEDFADDLRALAVARGCDARPICRIANRTRRFAGFSPSRTSGSARPMITLIA